jgi:excinuclease ABC subunit A
MIVAEGTPEEVAKDERSYTARFLKRELSEYANDIHAGS